MMKFPLPPAGMDTAVYNFLFQTVERLNLLTEQIAAGNAGTQDIAQTSQTMQGGSQEGGGQEGGGSSEYQELKALVIKTADSTYKQIESLGATLSGEYVAQSDFGSYLEKLNAELEANPDSITQYYKFYSVLQSNVAELSNSFSTYKTDTEAYIRTGIVYYEDTVPIYGVAVGQNLKTEDTSQGQTVVKQENFRATFTAQKLSFWQDTQEVAYVSNNKLYITSINVTGSIVISDKWRVREKNGGLCFQYIGS